MVRRENENNELVSTQLAVKQSDVFTMLSASSVPYTHCFTLSCIVYEPNDGVLYKTYS